MLQNPTQNLFRLGGGLLIGLGLSACGGGNNTQVSSSSVESSSSMSSAPLSSSSSSMSSSQPSSTSSSVSSSSSSSATVPSNWPLVVAINAGGSAAVNYEGVQYQADKYSRGGNTNSTTDPIAGVAEDALFQSERYGSYSYEVPVTAGTFAVKLHMAEQYWEEAGARTFNLVVENQTILRDFDLFSQAGHDGAFNYVVESVGVNDGALTIELDASVDAGTIAGFALYSADGQLDTSQPEPNCSGYVGITFDDGPANTNAFVNALKNANLVPVTFFVNGNKIASMAGSIPQMLEVGEVQSHGYTHDDMAGMGYQQAYNSLNQNNQAIQNAGAPKPTVFRPPYGSVSNTLRQAASDLGLYTITWDVDSQDWNGASPDDIVSRINQLQNGQNILMHENQMNTLTAIPRIAQALEAKGLCPGRIDPNTGRTVAP